ncbi:C1 family peptidase [Seonamhaeicola algicola]|uniref:C1 family peptidase n=1 Tax=Seonamhaeicola algicola TaxID=1719036 RepID=A0A5C7AU10_9FLAO|nr:C1 family peptidase [Seonamhaeicola algicola]TXE11594.1 C1 family peptidase [Seonamhaeicola algicola]
MIRYLLLIFLTFNGSLVLSQDNPQIGYFGEDEFLIDEEQSNSYVSFDEADYDDLPDSIDLSDKFPQAGNQGRMGSCWAWATTYAYFSYYKNTLGTNNFIFSPTYTYHEHKKTYNDCESANSSYKVLGKVLKEGSLFHSQMKYDDKNCNVNITSEQKKIALENAIPNYEVKMIIDDLFTMKKILSDGKALVISMKVDDNLFKVGQLWAQDKKTQVPIWNEFGSKQGHHAMVVTGYNEAYKAFKILNSWGSEWGDQGYIWIPYHMVDKFMNYSCYVREKKTDINFEELAQAPNFSPQKDVVNKSLLSTWVKKKYYRKFDVLKIGLIQFKPSKKFGIINITSSQNEDILKTYIELGETVAFYNNGIKYKLKFDNIGGAGKNPFKRAMYFTVSKSSVEIN